jgi:hypothetical protein
VSRAKTEEGAALVAPAVLLIRIVKTLMKQKKATRAQINK